MNSYKTQKGSSLVEMILYISILTIVLLVVFNTIQLFMSSYRNLKSLRIVEHSGIDAMERMTRDIRAASTVDTANSVLGINPGVLTLVATADGNSTTTKFYLQNNIVEVDVNGVYEGPLTLTDATTTKLVFTQIQSPVSSGVKIDMTVQGQVGFVTKVGSYHSTILLKGQ